MATTLKSVSGLTVTVCINGVNTKVKMPTNDTSVIKAFFAKEFVGTDNHIVDESM